MLTSLCVFCGSSSGGRPEYAQAAGDLGRKLASRGIRLVYGGSHAGLMGTLADACLEAGGDVIGVIPQLLVDKEIAHRGLPELRIVASMHERKATMADLADAFLALPGGFGTLEEFFEVVTWRQLRLHNKPCGLLNLNGYYDSLIAMADTAVREGFLSLQNRLLLLASSGLEDLLRNLERASAPAEDKWIRA